MSERSLKATSTPSQLILLSFLHYHHHPRPPNSLPTTHNNPAVSPSPPLRDVGSTINAPATAVSVPPLPSPEGCGLNYQHPRMCRTDSSHIRPSPFHRDVGGVLSLDGGTGEEGRRGGSRTYPRSTEEHGRGLHKGGPMKREAQAVCLENEPR